MRHCPLALLTDYLLSGVEIPSRDVFTLATEALEAVLCR